MEIRRTALPGVMTVEVAPAKDDRGIFARTYDKTEFAACNLPVEWPQTNTSWNARKGTLRGMHFQSAPKPDPKLVRCTQGRVFDVVVDLRKDSATYLRSVGCELSAENRMSLAIPAGCAHGFLTLEDCSEVFYMMGEEFVAGLASGVRWNDPAFSIEWPIVPVVMSDRDANWPDFVR